MIHLITPLLFAIKQAPPMPSWASAALSRYPTKSSELSPLSSPAILIGSEREESRPIGVTREHRDLRDPLAESDAKAQESSARKVTKYVRQGRYELAYIEASISGPDSQEAVDSALLAGRYSDAESSAAIRLSRSGTASNDDLLRLSVAVAMRGRVYPGQGAYVLGALQGPNVRLRANRRPPSTPRDVALASLLALGLRAAPPYEEAYLEWTLRLDPRNVRAANHLLDEYESSRRPEKAAILAASMVDVLPSGGDRRTFESALARLRSTVPKSLSRATRSNNRQWFTRRVAGTMTGGTGRGGWLVPPRPVGLRKADG